VGAWGFVALAYGIVWAALLIYLFTLKNRLCKAEARLAQLQRLRSKENVGVNAK
jgi:CcmD family protein